MKIGYSTGVEARILGEQHHHAYPPDWLGSVLRHLQGGHEHQVPVSSIFSLSLCHVLLLPKKKRGNHPSSLSVRESVQKELESEQEEASESTAKMNNSSVNNKVITHKDEAGCSEARNYRRWAGAGRWKTGGMKHKLEDETHDESRGDGDLRTWGQ